MLALRSSFIERCANVNRCRDVSGVELLMNNHQSLKAEIDAREENFNTCISLGRDLLNRKHYASSEIEKKLIKLTTERAEMMRRWEDRWEYLQLSKTLTFCRFFFNYTSCRTCVYVPRCVVRT